MELQGKKGIVLLDLDQNQAIKLTINYPDFTVWSWKQDPKQQSSIQGILVLDGLDLNRLHVEDAQGVLVPN